MKSTQFIVVQIIIVLVMLMSACDGKPNKSKKKKKSSPIPKNLVTHQSSFNPSTGEFEVDNHTVALWHFNEGKDIIATDSTKYNNAGVINGGTPWVRGRFGLGLRFANDKSNVEIEDKEELTPSHALSIEFWLFIDESQTKFPIVFSKDSTSESGDMAGNPSYHIVLHNVPQDQSVTIRLTTDKGLVPMLVKDAWRNLVNRWHYFAITYDSKMIRFYVDGKLLGSQNQKGKIVRNKNPLMLGNRTYDTANNKFRGIIDEMRISNKARSSRAIMNYWNAVSKK